MQSVWINSETGNEPITLTEAKLWLKQDEIDADDDIITGLIVAARLYCEDYTGRSFKTKNVSIRVEESDLVDDDILLKTVLDSSGTTTIDAVYQGVTTSVSSSVWEYNKFSNTIELKYNQEWPDYDYLIVTFDVLNEGTNETVKLAVKNYVAAAYEYRNDRPNMPLTKINNYLDSLRLWQFL